jgi:DNA-nicking Smr family endonuclease
MGSRKKPSNQSNDLSFSEAMGGVVPIHHDRIDYEPEPLPRGLKKYPDHVDPEPEFEGTFILDNLPKTIHSDERVHYQNDIADKIWGKLKKGDMRPELTLDLHHFKVKEAAKYLEATLLEAQHNGIRTLLVIHGKGSQKNPTPTLKNAVIFWCEHFKPIQGMLSAPSRLGGAGALLIYLRRLK